MLQVILSFKCHDKHNQRLNHFYAIIFDILIVVKGVKFAISCGNMMTYEDILRVTKYLGILRVTKNRTQQNYSKYLQI